MRAGIRPLLVPALVLTEVSYLLSDRIGAHAEVAFASSLADELVVKPERASMAASCKTYRVIASALAKPELMF